ncbi:MAG: fused MFS/spermidine synthase [Planctomycetes bacterium]|nr:fused MFS/spermidine synthase [Planctomycetota bacterium]
MSDNRGPLLGIWCAVTIFLSAFLLFQVQPVISKAILPWFGGSPSVWTTALLFFQTLLLLGYSYAHILVRWLEPRRATVLHLSLLVIAFALLPITPSEGWKPEDGSHPTLRILVLLLAHVGLPYFLLSATAPLVQVWYDRHHEGARPPYRLYALSNAGSLLALLSYPFIVEPALTIDAQGFTWSMLFGGFALVSGGLALVAGSWGLFPDPAAGTLAARDSDSDSDPAAGAAADAAPAAGADTDSVSDAAADADADWAAFVAADADADAAADADADTGADAATDAHAAAAAAAAPAGGPASAGPAPSSLAASDRVSLWRVSLWVFLPAVASMLLLAFTNHVCQDVAVVPFLWVLPLSLYLLSFIICFDREAWYRRRIFPLLALLAIAGLSALQLDEKTEKILKLLGLKWKVPDLSNNVILEASLYLGILFLVCIACHGELVRIKPPARRLTSFYLAIAAGGAIGGAFVAVVCPLIFDSYFETRLGLMAGAVLGAAILIEDARRTWLSSRGRRARRRWAQVMLFVPLTALTASALAVTAAAQFQEDPTKYIHVARSFYGVLKVKEAGEGDIDEHRRSLYHGRILHGVQLLDPAHESTPTSYYNAASGIGLAILNCPRLGPLRLGAVGLGAGTLAAYGEKGDTIRFYEINPQVVEINRRFFTFIRSSPARVDVILGDARLSLEREPSQQFDVLAVDAFSGDAIPVHLITLEAIEVYLRHIKPDGIIALHISNRHLDLVPVVRAVAAAHGLGIAMIDIDDAGGVADAGSTWMLLTVNEEFLQSDAIREAASPVEEDDKPPCLWTDRFSNLLEILK